jgi:hypothetical protein
LAFDCRATTRNPSDGAIAKAAASEFCSLQKLSINISNMLLII